MSFVRLGWIVGGCLGALACYLRNPDVTGILACAFSGGYFLASALDFLFGNEHDNPILDEETDDR